VNNFDHLPDSALIDTRHLLLPAGPVPYSKVTLWRRVNDGRFPRPMKLDGGKMNVWRLGEVRAWLESQGKHREVAA